jgi:hypothetical protein
VKLRRQTRATAEQYERQVQLVGIDRIAGAQTIGGREGAGRPATLSTDACRVRARSRGATGASTCSRIVMRPSVGS